MASLSSGGLWSAQYVPMQMVVFAAIWPVPYAISPAFKGTYLKLVGLGLVLFFLVAIVP